MGSSCCYIETGTAKYRRCFTTAVLTITTSATFFLFAQIAVVTSCAINAPGSIHDYCIAEWGGVYDALEKIFGKTGGRVVVDSAFARGRHPFLVKSAQEEQNAEGSEEENAEGSEEVTTTRKATSVRQASEWGMRSFQGSAPRIKDQFFYEERGERKLMMWLTVLLLNLCTRLVGMNQIGMTYMPLL